MLKWLKDTLVKQLVQEVKQNAARYDKLISVILEQNKAVKTLDRKVEEFMATQEERLQAISTKIDEVLSDLATLKANNPQIEDEITAIEAKLSITQPASGNVTP